jgi:4-hydroxybenzoyl-CoA thioesterase
MAVFVHRLPVRFSDVDHAGIVYYPRFFHFFHVVFEEFFTSRLGPRGYVDLLDRERIGFPAVSARCDYRAPLRFGDRADIEMAVTRLGEKSVSFGYRISRVGDGDAPDTLVAEGGNTVAVVDLRVFRAVPIPPRIRDLLGEITAPTAAGA